MQDYLDINDRVASLFYELAPLHDRVIAEAAYCLEMLSGLLEDIEDNGPLLQDCPTAARICKNAEFAIQALISAEAME